jgi:hypothetical protein
VQKLAVYLITCELHGNKNYERINESICMIGDCIRPLSSFWLVNTSLSFNELYNFVNSLVERNDMFYITSISSAGIGRLDTEDTDWIKNKFFIPATPLAPTGNTRGPLSIQQPAAAAQSRPAAVQRPQPAQKPVVENKSSNAYRPSPAAARQRYPELHWDVE